MKPGTRLSTTPGFKYDGKSKTATFNVIVPGTAGKVRKQKTAEGVSRIEASEAWKVFRDDVLGSAAAGLPPINERTLGWYVTTYGKAIAARTTGRTPTTEGQVIRRRLLPFFGAVPLDRINLALVRDFVGKLKAEGYHHTLEFTMREKKHTREVKGFYSPTTINDTLSVLRKLLRDAEAREVIDRYPIRGKLPREKETPLELELKGDEMTRFLGAFDDEAGFRRNVAETRAVGQVVEFNAGRHGTHVAGAGRRPDSAATGQAFGRFRWSKALFVIALETGLSRSDLLTLEWSAVDFDRGVVRIHRRKTGVAATIPLSAACLEAFVECRERNKRLKKPVISPLVFLDQESHPYSLTAVERHFELAKRLAGIERRLRLHDLRHTFGCNLASEGVPTSDIQKALGHTSARMSERYARSAPDASLDRMRTALDRMSTRMKTPAENGTGSR